jgi:hypothetical protein
MPVKYTDQQFIDAWKRLGSPALVAATLGLNLRGVYARRKAIEDRHGFILDTVTEGHGGRPKAELPRLGIRQLANITGPVIVFGDAHWWPGQEKSTAHMALLEAIREIRPAMIVANGDLLDLPSSSRHPPLGYGTPAHHDVAQEIAITQEYLSEIESLAPDGCVLVWNLGNHDIRLAARIAACAPELATLKGARLEDHFPSWAMGVSLMLNGNTMIKHRPPKGGIHATYGSIVASGLDCIVTNHCHALRITPLTTYRPRRSYGVDAGCLAEFGPHIPQFDYAEDGVVGWASGFAVIHVQADGTVLPPELCEVVGGTAYFRGRAIYSKFSKVSTKSSLKRKVAA